MIPFGRQRRWSTNDEVEIPVEQVSTDSLVNTSSTTADLNLPLLRQDIIETYQTDEGTTVAIDKEVSETNNTQVESVTRNELIDTNSTESEISNGTNQAISDSPTTMETTSKVI